MSWRRWRRATLILLTCASFASADKGPQPNKPNILIILADDLGYADVGFQGCKDIPTPHIDALARSGIRCTSGYVNHPFCSPTRAALMTGRYQQRFGHENNPAYLPNDERVGLPTSEVMLPQLLRAAGYVTGGVGKWHLGAAPPFLPQRRGFDEWFGFVGGGHVYQPGLPGSAEYTVPLMRNDKPNELSDYLTAVLGREAAAFIRRHRGQPWFLYLAFNAPHTPLQAPPELLDRFRHIANENRRAYAAMVHAMDDAVGQVLAMLRETGQERDTLVFFLSDNGGPLVPRLGPFTDNTPLRGHKGQVYEGGIRVPFVVRYPARLKGGRQYDQPVAAFDIFSTALAVAGAPPPRDRPIDGANLLPYLTGERKSAPHEFLFWRQGGPQGDRAARRGDWKLVRLAGGKEELYNLKNDIAESKDCAASHPEPLGRLRAALDAWDRTLMAPRWSNPSPARPAPPADDPAKPSARAPEAPVRPKIAAGDLRALTGYEFTIAAVTRVPAAGGVPEYCRVTGQILPEVRFEVSLPAEWNRRFYMFGNGGYAGESFEAPGRVGQRNAALRRGFAVAATDTGHDGTAEPLGTFATNRQKLLDYAFRSLHVTAETAKRIIRAYYGVEIARSYFQGCSTGGRQALILAQRFPKDFDGLIVGAPVLDFTGTMISYTWMARGLAEGPVPAAKLPRLAERIYGGCDEKDGLKDGLIEDPRRCGFAPARDLPRCPDDGDGPECFTSRQIAALERIYGDVVVGGKRLFPGWPVGAEIAPPGGRPGWDGWIVRDGGRPISVVFAESFFRYLAFPEKDPSYDLARFNFETDLARLDGIRQVLDATDTDLSSFRAAGGKMVMYFGWADPALNPRMGLEYYENAVARMGPSTSEFFRLFMVPGMFHCGGGVGLNTFDWLTPLMNWVEKGAAPDRIVGSRVVAGQAVRTRPVCPYPQTPRYRGTGSTDDAVSFECR